MEFETKIKIHFDEADPAGIAFSGGIFTKMHRCYEEFIVALDQDPKQFFLNPSEIYPIRHMEAEYLRPLLPLNEYGVRMTVIKISDSSFQLEFRVANNGNDHCVVRSTHVCVDKSSMKKASLPSQLKESLQKFATPQ